MQTLKEPLSICRNLFGNRIRNKYLLFTIYIMKLRDPLSFVTFQFIIFRSDWEAQRGLDEEVKIISRPIAKRFLMKIFLFCSFIAIFWVFWALIFRESNDTDGRTQSPGSYFSWAQLFLILVTIGIFYFALMASFTVLHTYLIITSQRIFYVMPSMLRTSFNFVNYALPFLSKLYGNKAWKTFSIPLSQVVDIDVREFADGSCKANLLLKRGDMQSWMTLLDHFPFGHRLHNALTEAKTQYQEKMRAVTDETV
jgi:magnesium-transporting ATPase (P-type)